MKEIHLETTKGNNMNTNTKSVGGKKRGRAAAPPDQKRNHQIPVTLDGHEKAKLNELRRRYNEKVEEATGMPLQVSEASLFRSLLQKAFHELEAVEGKIVLIPDIKVESQPESSTGTDD
jgi:hypothetical protein